MVWIPKHRRRLLRDDVASETKRLIAEVCAQQGVTLPWVETNLDHVHAFVSAPPRWSPAQLANLLKRYTSKYLRERFPHLKRLCGPDQLWTQAYYVGTVGQVSAETIRRYIQECQGK